MQKKVVDTVYVKVEGRESKKPTPEHSASGVKSKGTWVMTSFEVIFLITLSTKGAGKKLPETGKLDNHAPNCERFQEPSRKGKGSTLVCY